MEIIREVHCRVMKGLGPECTDKTVSVFIDDVEPGTQQSEINDMIRSDVKYQLGIAGFTHYTIEDIEKG